MFLLILKHLNRTFLLFFFLNTLHVRETFCGNIETFCVHIAHSSVLYEKYSDRKAKLSKNDKTPDKLHKDVLTSYP